MKKKYWQPSATIRVSNFACSFLKSNANCIRHLQNATFEPGFLIFSCLHYLTAVGAARIFVSDDVGRRRISANTVKTTVTIVVYFTAAKTDKYIQSVLKKMNRFEIVLNFVKLLVVL
jgi:hypothetical protein